MKFTHIKFIYHMFCILSFSRFATSHRNELLELLVTFEVWYCCIATTSTLTHIKQIDVLTKNMEHYDWTFNVKHITSQDPMLQS